MIRKNISKKSAFTLIELSIVIAVLSALIFGAVVGGRVLIDNAKVTSLMADITQLKKNIDLFQTIYGFFPGEGKASQITSSDNLACDQTGTSVVCYNLTNGFTTTPNEASADAIAQLFKAGMTNVENVVLSSLTPPVVDTLGYLGSGRSYVITKGGLIGSFLPSIAGASGDLDSRQIILNSHTITIFSSNS